MRKLVSVNISISKSDQATVAEVSGEVDADNCAELGAAVLDAELVGDRLVLSLAGLTFIDSTGISELLRIRQVLEERGQGLELHDPSPAVHRVLEITGLLDVFGLA